MNMHMVMAPPFGGIKSYQFQSVFSEADFFTHLSFITFTVLNSRFNLLCFHTLYYCTFTDVQLIFSKFYCFYLTRGEYMLTPTSHIVCPGMLRRLN